jgi:hypothetical protein
MEVLHGGDFDVVNATLRGMDLLQRHTSGIVLQYVFYEPPAKGVLRESWAPPQTQPIDWLSAAMAGDFEGPTSRDMLCTHHWSADYETAILGQQIKRGVQYSWSRGHPFFQLPTMVP